MNESGESERKGGEATKSLYDVTSTERRNADLMKDAGKRGGDRVKDGAATVLDRKGGEATKS